MKMIIAAAILAWSGSLLLREHPNEASAAPVVAPAPTKTALGGQALAALRGQLRSPDSDVRRAAIGALRGMSDPEVVSDLEPSLRDADPSVRAAALGMLGGTDDPRSPSLVAPLTSDPDEEVRSAAAGALLALQARRRAEYMMLSERLARLVEAQRRREGLPPLVKGKATAAPVFDMGF